MRMIRWMSGVTNLNRIRHERIRGTTKVGEISKKVQESRLKWYEHVLRREEEYAGKRVMAMEVQGKRRRGSPKRRWLDNIRNDLSERELSGEEAQASNKKHRSHIKVGKDAEELIFLSASTTQNTHKCSTDTLQFLLYTYHLVYIIRNMHIK